MSTRIQTIIRSNDATYRSVFGAWILKRPLILVVLGLVSILALRPAYAQSEKSYKADAYNVTATLGEGGLMLVKETVDFNFSGGPFTYVFRELIVDKTDGISDILASKDGRVLPRGKDPGEVEISGRSPIRVTWHLEPTWDESNTYDLEYQVNGVVRREADYDTLLWNALPDSYEYNIDSSRVVFYLPDSIELLDEPALVSGTAHISSDGGTITLLAENLAPNSPLIISLRFPKGTLISEPPSWQTQQERTGDLAWIWILGSIVILGVGLALAIIVSKQYRWNSRAIKGTVFEPPDHTPVAYVGALHSGAASIVWNHALGTLFDLANQGLVSIVELPKEGFLSSRDFELRRNGSSNDFRAHEEALLNLLFLDKQERLQSEVRLSKLNRLVTSSRWNLYTDALEGELKASQLIDVDRRRLRRNWILVSFLVGIFLLVLGILMLILFSSSFGFWPVFLVGSIFLLSLAWAIAGSSISILSGEGEKAAALWAPFYRYIKQVTRGKTTIADPIKFESYLPYAAAYGILHDWVRRFEKRGWTEVPGYFSSLERAGAQNMTAFVALAAATTTSGGSATGASAAAGAGASAAGGGASGAG